MQHHDTNMTEGGPECRECAIYEREVKALRSKLKAADEAWHEQEDELQSLRVKLETTGAEVDAAGEHAANQAAIIQGLQDRLHDEQKAAAMVREIADGRYRDLDRARVERDDLALRLDSAVEERDRWSKRAFNLAQDNNAHAAKLERAVDALRRHGYRESCDIPACNCGDQWNHGGHAADRLRELSDVIHENGVTLLDAAKNLVSRLGRAVELAATVSQTYGDPTMWDTRELFLMATAIVNENHAAVVEKLAHKPGINCYDPACPECGPANRVTV